MKINWHFSHIYFVIATLVVSNDTNCAEGKDIYLGVSNVVFISSMVNTRIKTKPIQPEEFEANGDAREILYRHLSSHDFVSRLNIQGGRCDDKASVAFFSNSAKRSGDILKISTLNGQVYKFNSWVREGNNGERSEKEEYSYCGMMEFSEFHKIRVDYTFGDEVGGYLVNAVTGKVLYADLVEFSITNSTKRLILERQSDRTITALSEDGNSVELQCNAAKDKGVQIISSVNPSYDNSYSGFDLVLIHQPVNSETYEAIPIRLKFTNGAWHMLVQNPQNFSQIGKFTCWQ